MNTLRDSAHTFGTVINRIHRGYDGKKNLCRADVACGFVAADVLLARLQREPIGGSPFGVVRHSDQAAGHVTFEFVARSKVRCMWPAESERNAEPLGIADGNVSSEFTRRFDQGQSKQIRRDYHKCAGIMRSANESSVVIDRAIGRGILNKGAENRAIELERRGIADLDPDPEWSGACFNNGNGLGVTGVGGEERIPVWNYRVTECRRLGSSRRFVEH